MCPTALSCLAWSSTSTQRTLRRSARRIQRPQASEASAQCNAVTPVRLRRIPPSFPPDKWNIHDATLTHGDITNNACDSWNNGFRQLIGHSHPGVWTTIESLSAARSGNVCDVANAARTRSAPTEASSTNDGAAAEEAAQAVLQLPRRKHCYMDAFLCGIGHTVRLA